MPSDLSFAFTSFELQDLCQTASFLINSSTCVSGGKCTTNGKTSNERNLESSDMFLKNEP